MRAPLAPSARASHARTATTTNADERFPTWLHRQIRHRPPAGRRGVIQGEQTDEALEADRELPQRGPRDRTDTNRVGTEAGGRQTQLHTKHAQCEQQRKHSQQPTPQHNSRTVASPNANGVGGCFGYGQHQQTKQRRKRTREAKVATDARHVRISRGPRTSGKRTACTTKGDD